MRSFGIMYVSLFMLYNGIIMSLVKSYFVLNVRNDMSCVSDSYLYVPWSDFHCVPKYPTVFARPSGVRVPIITLFLLFGK